MFIYVFIFTLSAVFTGQSNALQKIEKNILTESAYQSHEAKSNYVDHPIKRQGIYDYNPSEYEDDKEIRYNDEDRKLSGDLEGEEGSRRMFEWFSRLFQTTTPKTIQTTIRSESKYAKELKERIFLKALHRNLSDILFKLSDVEKRVSIAMDQKEAYSILTKGKPQVLGVGNTYYFHDRIKRELVDETKTEAVTENPVVHESVNSSKKSIDIIANTTECLCEKNVTSGRRVGSFVATPTEVKNKLLMYIQESFHEIKSKINAVKNLKQAFSDNVSFKIGYILANIDTLEVSMLNLKRNMDKNKEFWEDNKILELYDTLKVSSQAVSGLIESLKGYLEKLQMQAKSDSKFG